MNKFRLILLVFIFLASTHHFTYGQNIGFTLGLNTSYFGGSKYDGEIFNHDVKSLNPIYGLNSGLNIKFPNKLIFNLFYFETGFAFIKKGCIEKYDFAQFSASSSSYNEMTQINKVKIYFISLPFKLNTIIRIKNVKLILASGLYLARGVSGQVDSKNFERDSGILLSSSKYKINWTNNGDGKEYERARSDWGLTFGSGIQKGRFQVLIQIDRGFTKINVFENHIISFNLSTSYFINLNK